MSKISDKWIIYSQFCFFQTNKFLYSIIFILNPSSAFDACLSISIGFSVRFDMFYKKLIIINLNAPEKPIEIERQASKAEDGLRIKIIEYRNLLVWKKQNWL